MVASKDNCKRTLLTNYHAEIIDLAEDLAPSLSNIKDGPVTGAGELFFCVALYYLILQSLLLISSLLFYLLKVVIAFCFAIYVIYGISKIRSELFKTHVWFHLCAKYGTIPIIYSRDMSARKFVN